MSIFTPASKKEDPSYIAIVASPRELNDQFVVHDFNISYGRNDIATL